MRGFSPALAPSVSTRDGTLPRTRGLLASYAAEACPRGGTRAGRPAIGERGRPCWPSGSARSSRSRCRVCCRRGPPRRRGRTAGRPGSGPSSRAIPPGRWRSGPGSFRARVGRGRPCIDRVAAIGAEGEGVQASDLPLPCLSEGRDHQVTLRVPRSGLVQHVLDRVGQVGGVQAVDQLAPRLRMSAG